ncbi:hypothetical protein WJX74_002634 [Apatococcus lobatus]|uniref:E2 ubiquitin-conjugating enzyme n=2 Tax=Apatococcus TaxID=904362 RepID=A0AAW1T962_9CHLO
MDAGRIQKELKEIERDKKSGVSVQLNGDNIHRLTGFLEGPKDTAYQGGYFVVDIKLEDQYPFVPPKMRFRTKVWHPNISSANGAICLDILKDQWSPALTLKTALLSLQALLASPEPDDPQDGVVASQYIKNQPLFQRTARQWTEQYATRELASQDDEKVLSITSMGFPREMALTALESTHGDVNAAINKLLESC